MFSQCPYVMRDQVKNVVPHLMDIDAEGTQHRPTSFLELAIFAIAIGAYLLVLGVSS